MTDPTDDLTAALAAYRIELPDDQVVLVRRYCELLWEWNVKLNLTRHTDYAKFVSRDVVDSLAFAQFLEPDEKVLDVGTGGGVPGVLLAIFRPDLSLSLCDSVGKKVRAVADIVERLSLHVPVSHARAEELLEKAARDQGLGARDEGRGTRHEKSHRTHPSSLIPHPSSLPPSPRPPLFNSLVVRAVGTLRTLLGWLRPHWESFDRLLVLKGPAWVEERGEARHYGLLRGLALRKLTSYPMPGTKAESVLLQICPADRLEEGKACRLRRVE